MVLLGVSRFSRSLVFKSILAVSALVHVLPGTTQARAQDLLTIYTLGPYIPPDLLSKFTEETGIRIVVDMYYSSQELYETLKAGTAVYDIVIPEDAMVKTLIDEGRLLRIDAASMPNFVNVQKRFVDPWFDPGRHYSAPYLWGTTGFVYDPEQISGIVPESWEIFFEPPPELKGKIVALDEKKTVYGSAAFYLGIDPCTDDDAEAQRILDLLMSQKESLAYYANSGMQQSEIFSEGTVAVRQVWNGVLFRLKKQLPRLVYVYPKEGVPVWEDNFAVPSNAPRPNNAKTFINWMLQPENMAAATNHITTANAIEGSAASIDDELLADPNVIPPAEYEDRFRTIESCSPKAQALRDRVWARLWPRSVVSEEW